MSAASSVLFSFLVSQYVSTPRLPKSSEGIQPSGMHADKSSGVMGIVAFSSSRMLIDGLRS